MSFYLPSEHSCMANAVNNYFRQMVYTSQEHFLTTQRRLLWKMSRKRCGDYSIELLRHVQVGRHLYKRKYDYHGHPNQRETWPPRIPTAGGRCIIDYMSKRNEGHVEAATIVVDSITFLRTATDNLLPETSMTISECLGQVEADSGSNHTL